MFVLISIILIHLQDSIVKVALKIWIGTRMAQEFFCVKEENDFNIDAVHDTNSVHHGQHPVPPVLDHQLDVLMIIEMVKMKTVILEKRSILTVVRIGLRLTLRYSFYSRIYSMYSVRKRGGGRCTTTRSVAVKLIGHDRKLTFFQGKGNVIGEAYRTMSYRFMERYKHSAKNLLCHFRYCLKGPVPTAMQSNMSSISLRMSGEEVKLTMSETVGNVLLIYLAVSGRVSGKRRQS